MVLALALRERLTAPLQQQVGSSCGGRFERAQKLGRVQFVVPNFSAILYRSQDQLSDGRLSKKGGSAPSLIEQVVHRDEGFDGGQIRGRNGAMCRKTVVQADGDEQALADDMPMRESTPFQHHVYLQSAACEAAAGRGPAPQMYKLQGPGTPGPRLSSPLMARRAMRHYLW